MESQQPQRTEPTSISDRDNPFQCLMLQCDGTVEILGREAGEYGESMRNSPFVQTIEKEAQMLCMRGIYA